MASAPLLDREESHPEAAVQSCKSEDSQQQDMDGLLAQLAGADLAVTAADVQRKQLLAVQAKAEAKMVQCDNVLESVMDRIGDIVEDLRAARREGRDMTALWASMRPYTKQALVLQHESNRLHLKCHAIWEAIRKDTLRRKYKGKVLGVKPRSGVTKVSAVSGR